MEENRNEIMDVEETCENAEESKGGIGTGLAMLIGGGIALAATAGVKKLRKVWKNRKAKKNEEDFDDEYEFAEDLDEMVADDSKEESDEK